MTYIFLYLNLALFILPFLFSLDKKSFKIEQIRSAIIPALLVAIIFSEVSVFFTGLKIWIFNPQHLIGTFYRGIPIEQYLFVFSFNFFGLSVYNYLNAKISASNWQKYALFASNLLLGIFIAIFYFSYPLWYPTFTVAILFLLLIYIEYGTEFRFMGSFYRMFLLMLIPFYIVYGVLCNMGIIAYQATKTVGYNIIKIPFENHLYVMGMLLLSVFILEHLKKRSLQ